MSFFFFFFFNDTATTEIYTLSLHDALPIWAPRAPATSRTSSTSPPSCSTRESRCSPPSAASRRTGGSRPRTARDRKSTRLNSSHLVISYAVFCLKKKKNHICAEEALTSDVC